MTLAAVQNACADMISGVVVANHPNSIQSFVIPPDYDTIDRPTVVLLATKWDERREAGPRQGETGANPNYTGKYVTYEMSITAINIYDPETIDRSDFATLVHTIQQVYQGNVAQANGQIVSLPMEITDPVSGETSWITSIGENWHADQFQFAAMEEGSSLWGQCEIVMSVEEQATG